MGQMQKIILGALHRHILELTVQQGNVRILLERHVSRTRKYNKHFCHFPPLVTDIWSPKQPCSWQ